MAENETTSEDPRAVTLELIFRQGQRVLGELGQIRGKQDEIIVRLVRAEREVVATRREITNLHQDWVDMAKRLDNLELRFSRVERRLGLIDDDPAGGA
jgi:hypothetical protein